MLGFFIDTRDISATLVSPNVFGVAKLASNVAAQRPNGRLSIGMLQISTGRVIRKR